MNPERADSTLAFRLDSSRIPCYRGRRRCPAPEDISARPANNVTVPTSGGPPLLGRTLAVAVALAVALAVGLAADTHPPKQSSSGMVARVMRRRHDSSRFHPRKLGCITLAGARRRGSPLFSSSLPSAPIRWRSSSAGRAPHFHGFGVARQGPWTTSVNKGKRKD